MLGSFLGVSGLWLIIYDFMPKKNTKTGLEKYIPFSGEVPFGSIFSLKACIYKFYNMSIIFNKIQLINSYCLLKCGM